MTGTPSLQSLADLHTDLLNMPPVDGFLGQSELTNAMLITWFSRRDLQQQFDIHTAEGRRRLSQWCLGERDGRNFGQRLLRQAKRFTQDSTRSSGKDAVPGVNLIGYARGILGMGEHLRMSAAAMAAADVPAGIVDFTLGLGSRRQPSDTRLPKLRWPKHRCNLFHINADQMPRTYWHLGHRFFADRYNVGYWAWELAKWPVEWAATLGMVDEIWAPSRFVRDALAPATRKPVEWMPLCIELAPVARMPRSQFGASEDDYLFVFTFDCHSYFDRKNPLAVVRAFRRAFPAGARVRLILKSMHSEVCAAGWDSLLAEVSQDERIHLIDEVWTRERVLALINCCDAYVSLHRSEGFGRGPAEAMLLGKPVIITDYSGTADFCREDNTLLVNYSLVDVAPDRYVNAAGQVWAEPSIEHAAEHMQALFHDRMLGPQIGAKGRQTVSEEFSAVTIGRRYRARLQELGMI